jgi:hypothetical protein
VGFRMSENYLNQENKKSPLLGDIQISKDEINEYRALLSDTQSTDDQINQRLIYLKNFCRNIIKIELDNLCKKK